MIRQQSQVETMQRTGSAKWRIQASYLATALLKGRQWQLPVVLVPLAPFLQARRQLRGAGSCKAASKALKQAKLSFGGRLQPVSPPQLAAGAGAGGATPSAAAAGPAATAGKPGGQKPARKSNQHTAGQRDLRSSRRSSCCCWRRRRRGMLWAAKYAPAAAAHVCGNAAAVVTFKQFLQDWAGKSGSRRRLRLRAAARAPRLLQGSRSESGSSWWQSARTDGASSLLEGQAEPGRCTCLALLGPSGSGKTAAVYAVAEELGFRVLEVNPSVERTAGQANRCKALTLVLFDEADALLDTDRGFLAALPGLIRDSRRPIVLCLNSPQLPAALASVQGLQVQQVPVPKPSQAELVRLLVLVLAAEGRIGMRLMDVQQLVQQQGQDVRACLAALHFCSWLQPKLVLVLLAVQQQGPKKLQLQWRVQLKMPWRLISSSRSLAAPLRHMLTKQHAQSGGGSAGAAAEHAEQGSPACPCV
ncbi:hypothetical protein COO60DRAFT_1462291 [Scenedesmus sp. NREL 46B-D3]|nr:hypothetical protein COO60DRAFT_1462291 [Scenedesmus sp. NREL 46B-D3]